MPTPVPVPVPKPLPCPTPPKANDTLGLLDPGLLADTEPLLDAGLEVGLAESLRLESIPVAEAYDSWDLHSSQYRWLNDSTCTA
jgi:hypothetical protein